MARKHHKLEEIVANLRQVEVLTAQVRGIPSAVEVLKGGRPYPPWASRDDDGASQFEGRRDIILKALEADDAMEVDVEGYALVNTSMNAIERLHEEFKRHIKTLTVPPSAQTAAMLLWALLASGHTTRYATAIRG